MKMTAPSSRMMMMKVVRPMPSQPCGIEWWSMRGQQSDWAEGRQQDDDESGAPDSQPALWNREQN